MKYEGKENLDIMSLATNYNSHILKWVDEKSHKKILDFGAGLGEFCNKIEPKKIIAVELDDEQRKNILCKSYKTLDEVSDNSFDLIYTLNVLEHIKNDAKIVKQLSKKLKPNGVLKILVPAHMSLYCAMDKQVGHFRRYEKNELESLVKNANLKIISCKHFDFLGYFVALVFKFISNSPTINPNSLIIYDKFLFPISKFIDTITNGSIIGKNLTIIAKKPHKKEEEK